MLKTETVGAVERERERELYSSEIENSLNWRLTNKNNIKLNKVEIPVLIV